MSLSLREHILRSRQAVEANKAKGNRHAEILMKLYAEPARFLEEIIQNTEDAYAAKRQEGGGKLTFRLYGDRLDIIHQGKNFDEEDLKAITTFAASGKAGFSDINIIGKFGIGFRSVFSVTRRPEIHCPPWHFRIEDYEVLEETEAVPESLCDTTLIRLPFREESRKEDFKTTEQGLLRLDAKCLLFLSQVRCIQIYRNNKLLKSLTCEVEPVEHGWEIRQLGEGKNDELKRSYLCISPVSGEKCDFIFAFRISEYKQNLKRLVPESGSKYFVYFNTLQDASMYFLFHACFTTNPTREYIPLDQKACPENIQLLHRAARFLAASLIRLRDLAYLEGKGLEALMPSSLPVPENDKIGKRLEETLREALTKKKLLPVYGGTYANAEEMVYTRDAELRELLGKRELSVLFQKKYCLSGEVTRQEGNLSALPLWCNIREADVRSMAFRIATNPAFLQQQPISWLIRFYNVLSLHPEVWDESHAREHFSLRFRPLIRLSDGRMTAPFDEAGHCLFSLEAKQFPGASCPERRLMKDPDALRFLRMLSSTQKFPHADSADDKCEEVSPEPGTIAGFAAFVKAVLGEFHPGTPQELLDWGHRMKNEWLSGAGQNQAQALKGALLAVRTDAASPWYLSLEDAEKLMSQGNHAALLMLTRNGIQGAEMRILKDPRKDFLKKKFVFEPLAFRHAD